MRHLHRQRSVTRAPLSDTRSRPPLSFVSNALGPRHIFHTPAPPDPTAGYRRIRVVSAVEIIVKKSAAHRTTNSRRRTFHPVSSEKRGGNRLCRERTRKWRPRRPTGGHRIGQEWRDSGLCL